MLLLRTNQNIFRTRLRINTYFLKSVDLSFSSLFDLIETYIRVHTKHSWIESIKIIMDISLCFSMIPQLSLLIYFRQIWSFFAYIHAGLVSLNLFNAFYVLQKMLCLLLCFRHLQVFLCWRDLMIFFVICKGNFVLVHDLSTEKSKAVDKYWDIFSHFSFIE